MEMIKSKYIITQRNVPNKLRIIKNAVLLSVSFVFLFTAYNGISVLQSTMNQEELIGITSQAIIYACSCISCLSLPKYFIRKCGIKFIILICMFMYMAYIAANFYPYWITMIPSAVLVGLSGGLLWSSFSTYFNKSSYLYSLCFYDTVPKFTGETFISTFDNLNQIATISESINCSKYANLDEISEYNSGTANDLGIEQLGDNQKSKVFATKESMNCKCPLVKALSSNTESIQSDISSARCNLPKLLDVSDLPADKRLTSRQKLPSENEAYNHGDNRTENITKTNVLESITSRFFGFHGLSYQSTHIWGNLVSYYVLKPRTDIRNATSSPIFMCGAFVCNLESDSMIKNLVEPNSETRYVITGIYVVLVFTAIFIVLLFVDRLETSKESEPFSLSMLMATCRFLKTKEHFFLIPIVFYIGIEQAFYIADYTKSYISCATGAHNIGLVTVCYGCASTFSSSLSGWLVKHAGRIPVILMAAIVNFAANILLLLWHPSALHPEIFFIVAAMWGTMTGILWSQMHAFYGILFKKEEEAAFASFLLCVSLGYSLFFFFSNYVCISFKIYILLSVSSLGVLGYLKAESMYSQKKEELED
ncbi:protein unc-93 homolog A-like [Stegodyphus dumicola]|uniref:protein unc-93 homolog A-like n=1 Tax=Stegodyphus dumicola TaxID=202533 RepID=UPI0015B0905A|nr:protein unc-93 homolog A-like [Stegodyphus dumicola]